MNYPETIQYLYSALPVFHRTGPAAYKASLDNIKALCKALGNPEKGLRCIHIAGTNGKGSVSNMLASVLQEAGYRTGLFTSPHLKDYRERIRINGEMVSEKWLTAWVESNMELFSEIKPSFFEMSTAMAFCYFREMNTDINVIETGLGGRLDSTNVISPVLCVITNVGWDHMNLLGDSLEKIAIEKAGIIKENIPVVLGEENPETIEVFRSVSKEKNAELIIASEIFSGELINYDPLEDLMKVKLTDQKKNEIIVETDLTGKYQKMNLQTAITAIKKLQLTDLKIKGNSIIRGIKNVKTNTGFAGRWQVLQKNPLVICDTGHNTDGLKEVMSLLEEIKKDKLHFVLGMVNDKDVSNILKLLPKDAIYYFCKADIPRGMPAEQLQQQGHVFGLKGKLYASVKDAFESAKRNLKMNEIVFVGGSTFTVAEIL